MHWLNENSDALMVLITIVYVIATILIWIANWMSAKASSKQLEESKRQFEESQKQAKKEIEESKHQFEVQKNQFDKVERVKNMPYLFVEQIETSSRNSNTVFTITLSNQGNGSLLDLSLKFKKNPYYLIVYEGNYSYACVSPFEARFLRVEAKTKVEVMIIEMPKDKKAIDQVLLTFIFKDMLDNYYEQTIKFVYNDLDVLQIETYSPEYSLKQ